jgi:hypothetical protein
MARSNAAVPLKERTQQATHSLVEAQFLVLVLCLNVLNTMWPAAVRTAVQ